MPFYHRVNQLAVTCGIGSLVGDSLTFIRPIFPLPGLSGWFGLALGFTPLLSHFPLLGRLPGSGTGLDTSQDSGDSTTITPQKRLSRRGIPPAVHHIARNACKP
jgi:hypothetical protein